MSKHPNRIFVFAKPESTKRKVNTVHLIWAETVCKISVENIQNIVSYLCDAREFTPVSCLPHTKNRINMPPIKLKSQFSYTKIPSSTKNILLISLFIEQKYFHCLYFCCFFLFRFHCNRFKYLHFCFEQHCIMSIRKRQLKKNKNKLRNDKKWNVNFWNNRMPLRITIHGFSHYCTVDCNFL